MKFQDFLIEFFKRFAIKTPQFFQILQKVGLIALGIGFIPDALAWLDIVPNDTINKYITLAVKVAGGVTWVISKLPATDVQSRSFTELPYTKKTD